MCFGNMTKAGKTDSSSFTHQTTSNTYDPWVTQGGKDIYGAASSWLNNNPWQNYSGPTSASFGPEFDKASGYLQNMLGTTNPYTTAAGKTAQSVADSIDPNKSISDYMSPYTEGVLAPTLRAISERAGQLQQANAARATMAGAYGGTGHGVMDAMLQRDTQRSVGDATAQGYDRAYNQAQTARLGNLDRLLSAGSQLASVGQQEFGQGTTLASLLATIGQQRQAAGQRGIQNDINLHTQNQTMPLNRFGMLAQILRGLPLNSTSTTMGFGGGQQQSYAPDNSGFNFLGTLLSAAL